MNRITLSLITATFVWTGGLAAAANKPDKADRVVDAVLQLESRGTVTHRADDLGGALDHSDRARWAAGYVRTSDGWQFYDASTVIDDRLREYESRRGNESLAAEQHLVLANWSRDQKLREQERAHLWAALDINSNQPVLWQRLGFTAVDGKWLSQDERQEIERHRKATESAYKVWLPRATRLHKRLNDTNPTVRAIAQTELNEIDDPTAIPAMERQLTSESSELTASFVGWCKRMRSIDSTLALARQSIIAPTESLRNLAADALRDRRREHYVPVVLSLLATPIESTAHVAPLSRRSLQRGAVVLSVQFQTETWDVVKRINHSVVSVGQNAPRTQAFQASGETIPFARIGRETLRMASVNQRSRIIVDLERQIQEEIQIQQDRVAQENRQQTELNKRVAQAISTATGMELVDRPESLWHWWHQETGTDAQSPEQKSLVEISETEIYVPETPIALSERSSSCLPAGTPIKTSTGMRSIESLRIGDLVLAKEIQTGELAYKPVIRTTVRSPQPLTTLHTKGDSIQATLGHYFWVSGQGWRMAKEIQPGDRLHGVQGTVAVTDVSPGGREPVYNLVVEGANSYFVGESQILSHDVTSPLPTDIVVPGLAAR